MTKLEAPNGTHNLRSRPKHRVQLRAPNLAERRIPRHHMFKQRIVIEHIRSPRELLQGMIQIVHYFDLTPAPATG